MSTLETLQRHFAGNTHEYLYKLFPYGYAIQACRIAGTRVPLKIMLDL
jgi:tRNA 2-thiouridine synthesizing protein E